MKHCDNEVSTIFVLYWRNRRIIKFTGKIVNDMRIELRITNSEKFYARAYSG